MIGFAEELEYQRHSVKKSISRPRSSKEAFLNTRLKLYFSANTSVQHGLDSRKYLEAMQVAAGSLSFCACCKLHWNNVKNGPSEACGLR